MKKSRIKKVLAVVLTASIALGIITIAFGGVESTISATSDRTLSLEGKSGINLHLGKCYNENRLVHALIVTATMAIVGIVVGQITEFGLRLVHLK